MNDRAGSHAPAPAWARRRSVLPWVLVALAVLAVGIRAGIIQASVPEGASSSLDDYLSDALAMWFRGSLALLVVGAILWIVPVSPMSTPLARLGWAWAIWSTFVACVMPRAGNFFTNGGVDDEFLVYAPASIVAVVFANVSLYLKIRPGLFHLWTGLAVVAFFSIGMFSISGGYQLRDVLAAAGVTSVVSVALAGLAIVYRTFVLFRS